MFELKSTYNYNTDIDDYLGKPTKKPKLKPRAFCSSHSCADNQHQKLGKEKFVHLSAIDCPDCKSALYWTCDPHDFSYL